MFATSNRPPGIDALKAVLTFLSHRVGFEVILLQARMRLGLIENFMRAFVCFVQALEKPVHCGLRQRHTALFHFAGGTEPDFQCAEARLGHFREAGHAFNSCANFQQGREAQGNKPLVKINNFGNFPKLPAVVIVAFDGDESPVEFEKRREPYRAYIP